MSSGANTNCVSFDIGTLEYTIWKYTRNEITTHEKRLQQAERKLKKPHEKASLF